MFNLYPYSDAHELNLDWIILKIKELGQALTDFEAVNKITNAGAWDITKQYQAWTIVSDNNTGYISLKPVPAGVSITNTEYWGVVADYDILITDLSGRIAALEGQMSGLLNTTIPGIYATDTMQSNKIKALEDNNDLSQHYYLIVSDSYGAEVSETKWPSTLKMMLGCDNDHFLNMSVSGSGFLSDYPIHTKFIEQLQDPLSLAVADKITDILVIGGLNDSQPTLSAGTAYFTNLVAEISDFFTYAHAHYPNAKIYIGYAGNAIDTSTGINGRVFVERNYCKWVYQTYANYHGAEYIPYLDRSWTTRIGYFYSDHQHPSFASGVDVNTFGLGCWLLAAAIYEYLKGGIPDPRYPYTTLTVHAQGNFSTPPIKAYSDKDFLYMMNTNKSGAFYYLDLSTATTFDSTTVYDIFTQDQYYFNVPYMISCSFLLADGVSKTYTAQGAIIFDGYKVSMIIYQGNDSGSWYTYPNITRIMIDKNILQIPFDIIN